MVASTAFTLLPSGSIRCCAPIVKAARTLADFAAVDNILANHVQGVKLHA